MVYKPKRWHSQGGGEQLGQPGSGTSAVGTDTW